MSSVKHLSFNSNFSASWFDSFTSFFVGGCSEFCCRVDSLAFCTSVYFCSKSYLKLCGFRFTFLEGFCLLFSSCVDLLPDFASVASEDKCTSRLFFTFSIFVLSG